MKTARKIATLTLVLILALLSLALTACGELEMTSFVVVRASVKTEYIVGEAIDFSGISADVKYNDAALNKTYTFHELTIDYPADITAAPGIKEITVSFEDPNLGVTQSTTVQIMVNEDPNAVKHHSYIVKTDEMDLEYFIGETVNLSGLKLYEKMSDASEVLIADQTGLTFTYDAATITATAGMKVITMTYNGEAVATPITINVKAPAVTGTELDTTGIQTVYTVGDTITGFAGLSATVRYENGTSETVTDFTYVTDLSTLTATYGEKSVTVRFGNALEKTFRITVDGVTGYVLNDSAAVKGYRVGDALNFSGVTVTEQHFIAANTKTVSAADLTFDGSEGATATKGTKTITVKYGTVTVGDFDITVAEIAVTATLNTNNASLSYRVGDTVDPAELSKITLTLRYDDGTPDLTVAWADLTKEDMTSITATAGSKRVKLTYADAHSDATVTEYLTVEVHGIVDYEIDTTDMKLAYIAGGTIDFDGLKVYALYSDGGQKVPVDITTLTLPSDSVIATEGLKVGEVRLGDDVIGHISFSVTKNAVVKTEVLGAQQTCEQNKTPDFSGVTLKLTYTSGETVTLSYADLTLSTLDTSSLGIKTVTVKYPDAKNGEEGEDTFRVEIIPERLKITEFAKPEFITEYEKNNENAGTIEYGGDGFSGVFVNGKTYYTVGSYNAFKFLPKLSTATKDYSEYFSEVEVWIKAAAGYEKLSPVSAAGSTDVLYYAGNVLMVTVDTYRGSYQFTADANGKVFKLSVLPSNDAFRVEEDADVKPAVLELEVIDAYNAYTAKDLSVIDNAPSEDGWMHISWDDFKNANGIPIDANIKGVVLHNNIHIDKDGIPGDYFYTLETAITYKKGDETTTIPAGTKYLRDQSEIYKRVSTDQDFIIEGNFFSIDTVKFPLVASPAVFGQGSGKDYGSDFSNSTLFRFDSTAGNTGVVTMQNVRFEGNAPVNNYTDMGGNLVSAGGLILVKAAEHTNMVVKNAIGNSYFISYFPESNATMLIKDVKCYNSYQNAVFAWSTCTLTVETSYFNYAGGPIILSNSNNVDIDGEKYWHKPVIIVDEATKLETSLSGEEIWFNSVGAGTTVSAIKALGEQLRTYGFATFIKDNKMNIMGLLMADGTQATDIVTGFDAEGSFAVGDTEFVRLKSDAHWNTLYSQILTKTYGEGAGKTLVPILTVYGADGTPYSIYYNGETFIDVTTGNVFNGTTFVNPSTGQPEAAATIAAFQSAKTVVLTQGGLSVIFELYH